jgi:hypothetical protein
MNSLLRYDSWRVPGAAPPVAGRPVAEAAAEAFLPDADSEMEPQAAWRCALGDSQSLLMGDGLFADSQNGEASRGGAADTLQGQREPGATDLYSGAYAHNPHDESPSHFRFASDPVPHGVEDSLFRTPMDSHNFPSSLHNGQVARAIEARQRAAQLSAHNAALQEAKVAKKYRADELYGASLALKGTPRTPEAYIEDASRITPPQPSPSTTGRRSMRKPAPTERGLAALEMEKDDDGQLFPKPLPVPLLPQLRATLPPGARRGRAPASNAAKRSLAAASPEDAAAAAPPAKRAKAPPPPGTDLSPITNAALAMQAASAAAAAGNLKATDHWTDSMGRKVRRGCLNCGLQKTPQWRMGPMGPKTLCNACGVRYRKEVEDAAVRELEQAGRVAEAPAAVAAEALGPTAGL